MVIYQNHSQSFVNCYISKPVIGYFRGLQLDIIENHWLSVSISLSLSCTYFPYMMSLQTSIPNPASFMTAIICFQTASRPFFLDKGNTVRDLPKLPLNSSCSSIWTADSADEGNLSTSYNLHFMTKFLRLNTTIRMHLFTSYNLHFMTKFLHLNTRIRMHA